MNILKITYDDINGAKQTIDFSSFVRGLKVEYETLVSNSSRNARGDIVVDIIGRKRKVNVDFIPMNDNDMKIILDAIDPHITLIEYLDPKSDEGEETKTINAVVSSPSIDYYLAKEDKKMLNGISLTFSEL